MMTRRPIITETSDEEEEECNDRGYNLRFQKKVKCSKQSDDDKEEDNCNQIAQEAEACVWCGGESFTPTVFEDFVGREDRKRCKASITYEGIRLPYLFQRDLLRRKIKMKRKSPRVIETSDEEDEESEDRRRSLRTHKKVRYSELLHDDKEENNSNPSLKENMGFLLVKCGNKEGHLDKEKLQRGSNNESILCDGQWITPHAFEILGEKGSSKKWKISITHEDKPLQHWFEEGALIPPPNNKKKSATKSSNREPEETSEDMESEQESEEDVVEDEESTEESDKDEEQLAKTVVQVSSEEEGEEIKSLLLKKVEVNIKRIHLKEQSTSSNVTQPEAHHPTHDKQQLGSRCAPPCAVVQNKEVHDETVETSDAVSSQWTENTAAIVVKIESPHEEITEHTATGSDDYDATQSSHSKSKHKTRTDRTGARPSNMMEAAESSDVETMDSDQLKREKLQLEVKVLRLQERYYALKISRLLNK